jgi:predicted alpha/beta-hydrolase family hydrolase
MRRQTSGRVFLGGHSYGGRQASLIAAAEPGLVDHLLLLAYPLHPPQRPAELRTAHFPRVHTNALFVHGTRDGFGSVDEVAAELRLIPARTNLLPIRGAGHELMTKRNSADVLKVIVETFHLDITA